MLTTTDIAAEQAADQADEILDRLAELGVKRDELLTSEGWTAWLDVARRFHRYSFLNTVLIAHQRPTATQVAGYGRWKDLGRQVRKGERSIKIWVPRTRRRRDDDGEERRVLTGFGIGHVFDISQTDGDPLPEQPAWPMLDVELVPFLFDEIAQQASAVEGIDVYVPRPDEGTFGARGWYEFEAEPHRIAVRVDQYSVDGEITTIPPASRVKTLLHELGHHFDPAMTLAARAQAEVVAESVAHLVCADLGIDATEASAFYLAGWDPDGKELMAVGNRIKVAYEAITAMLKRHLDVPVPVADAA